MDAYEAASVMVEVFKTNVKDPDHAHWLINRIHEVFTGYEANFDLEDCDQILRVKCTGQAVKSSQLMHFLLDLGCIAEILPDHIKTVSGQTGST